MEGNLKVQLMLTTVSANNLNLSLNDYFILLTASAQESLLSIFHGLYDVEYWMANIICNNLIPKSDNFTYTQIVANSILFALMPFLNSIILSCDGKGITLVVCMLQSVYVHYFG